MKQRAAGKVRRRTHNVTKMQCGKEWMLEGRRRAVFTQREESGGRWAMQGAIADEQRGWVGERVQEKGRPGTCDFHGTGGRNDKRRGQLRSVRAV
jgi:hypothetical protein